MQTDAMIPMGGAEACELLGVSRDTLIRMIAAKKIKNAVKLSSGNGAWILDRTEIEQLARDKEEAAS